MDPYSGARWQKGHGGIGQVFGGLMRVARPLLGSVKRTLIKRGLKQGLGLAEDVLAGRNVKQAAAKRLKNVVMNSIQDTVSGASGAPPNRRKRKRAGGIKAGASRKRARRAPGRRHGDIFG